MVSGHWEAPSFTVQTHPNPPMLYDYGGFPDFTYHLSYPAPGAPEVAAQVADRLEAAGLPTATDPHRGFDHGTFVPMAVAWPDAEVPTLQLSIQRGYDPATHLAVGRALAPLRHQGVLIVGSGLTYHNLGDFGPTAAEASRRFEAWLTESLVRCRPDERTRRLLDWEQAPAARHCHPAEDHLIPLMVTVGAAEGEPGQRAYHQDDFMGNITSASYRFG